VRLIARAAAGVAGTGLAIFAGVGAMGDETTRDQTGAIVESGGLGAFAMRVGDCFDEPDAEQVVSVEGLPCDAPHDAEVFALWDLEHEVFPSEEEALLEEAWNGCFASFEAYVGAPYENSTLDIWVMTPTAQGWSGGTVKWCATCTTSRATS
jgi:hypothetical protein